MSLARYGARSAGFALLYLLALFAGHALDGAFWPAAAVGAVWLVAQGAYGPRRFDALAMLVLAALVPDTDTVLAGMTQAVPQVLPAVLFAWLLDRWLPLYWHGVQGSLGRLAGASALAGVSGAVLQGVLFPADFTFGTAGWAVVRDTLTVALVTAVVRELKRRYAPAPRIISEAPREDHRETLRHRLDEVFTPEETPSPAAKPGKRSRSHLRIVK
ncbi:hypothetical protein AB0J83_46670 [Actinoplanes sp. NPDC049596]|uniref:hypothetical protein n=1 Tax=unclassified Actinoplanes TaxID=2626549 RepID=UPI003413C17E